jgi:MFS family permease
VSLGVLLALLAAAGPISRFLQRAESATGLTSLADFTSLLAIVVLIALLAGVAYALVAIPSQTQLQEDIPEDVRGRVFGVLNMLVSVASFAPIIIVGPVADLVGNTTVLFLVAAAVFMSGVLSIVTRGPLKPVEAHATAHGPAQPAGLDPVAVATAAEIEAGGRRSSRRGDAGPLVTGDPVGDGEPTAIVADDGEPEAVAPAAAIGDPPVAATPDDIAGSATDVS